MLKTAVEAAVGAGRVIAERYPGGRSVTMKGFRDLVTDADTAAESLIFELIQSRFPDHAIISEEAGGDAIGNGYTWVVDPLDGTTNYAHHYPVFAVSIGVLEGGNPFMGVIHDPLRDQTFVAQRGAGARLNNVPIYVSGTGELGIALIGLDWGHDNAVRELVMKHLNRILPRCGTVRVSGSAALSLAYVAAGRLEAYFHMGLKPWDAAAGMLLVQEAGGQCTTVQGEPYRVQLSDCVATNRFIHDELLAVMHGKDE
ncbi:MAG: inositol monophosphatase family protein [Thermodesulfobacteriota bacterium]